MWMFYSKSTNTRINHLHQRACRLIYYYELTFEELSEIDGSSLFAITIFRCHMLNCINYTRTSQKLFSVICLLETGILIIYGQNLFLSF